MKRKNLIINTFLLTISTMLLGFLGMLFKVYLSNKIKSEGMGLFQLIMSVNSIAFTISISGIRITLTRLIAEAISKKDISKIKLLLRMGILYSLFFSTTIAFILYTQADFISKIIVSDSRCTMSFKVLAFCIPFNGILACFNGYFYGCRKVVKSIASDFIENITMIAVVSFFITTYTDASLEYTCCYATLGMSIGSIVACICSYIMYLFDRKNQINYIRNTHKSVFLEVVSIAIPIAVSAYIQTFLRSIEDILIPKALKSYSFSSSQSLSIFGVIKGMALPVLNFPSIFLASFSTLIIPEIAKYNVLDKQKSVNFVISMVMRFTFMISIFSTGFFIGYSDRLGMLLYNNSEVGFMIKILAPLVPLMYLDRIVDGSLNTLNQQFYTLKYNLIDMSVRILLINTLIPKTGITGFIIVLFTSTILNSSLGINRLIKITKLDFCIFDWIIKPSIAVFISIFSINKLITYIKIPSIIFEFLLILSIYIAFLLILKCIRKRDISWFIDAFKNDPKSLNWSAIKLYRQI